MRFAISLLLCHLVEWLETHPCPGVGLSKRLPAVGLDVEHETVGQVAVVWDRQDSAPGFRLVGGHVFPQVLRVDGVVLRIGQDLADSVRAIPEDHHPVQVVALWVGGPFETVESRKDPGLVVAIGVLHHPGPDGLHHPRFVDHVDVVGLEPLDECIVALSCLHHVMPALAGLVARRIGSERRIKSARPRFSA